MSNNSSSPIAIPGRSAPLPDDVSASPNPNDYDTGVTNGDVDWLFRGKSKKLTKKMNSQQLQQLQGCQTQNGSQHSPSNSNYTHSPKSPSNHIFVEPPKDTPKEGPKPTLPVNIPSQRQSSDRKFSFDQAASVSPASATPKTTPVSTPVSTPRPTKPAVSPASSPAVNNMPPPNSSKVSVPPPTLPAEKQSKLDKFKFGRTRSVSASSANRPQVLPDTTPTPRRGSTNTIVTPEDVQNPDTSNSRSSQASSVSSSPGVSRSNSTGGKTRSLFSSLSSKFKTSQASPAQNAAAPGSSPSSSTLSKVASNMFNSSDELMLKSQETLGTTPPGRSRSSISSTRESPQSRPRSFSKESGSISDYECQKEGSLGFFRKNSNAKSNRIVLNKNKSRKPSGVRELSEVNLRRVTFAIDKLAYDPQQQIPSRRPRKGNVLIPEDIIAPPPRLSLGISLSDGGKVTQENKYSDKELNMAIEAQQRALLEAEKHAQEAHLAAKRIAAELQSKSKKSKEEKELDEKEEEEQYNLEHENDPSNNIEIDKPLHMHENHFEESEDHSETITLETIYTRCCHLREILPIPATLKQLKNKTKPLAVLKLLNPKPTLIDVLSFSDFIAITPINTIIFDNVTMTTEMLKHFLSSLQYNTSLEKLSLRNVAIDEIGWTYLCKLLTTNLNIKKLDISQQRIKSDTKPNCIRSAMNWNLLINSIISRGGIEELVINGCKLNDATFENLIDNAVKINTYRLGIASTELNVFKAQKVANWIIEDNSKCLGVDLAFNDLSNGQLVPFIEAFDSGAIPKLAFFSLNSTNLSDIDETGDLINGLSKLKGLRFLDLSSLPSLFPNIISKLSEYLPRFPTLKRIQFDLNELSVQAIRAIAEILPKMSELVHVSLLGNRNLNHNSAGSLYSAVKLSHSIFSLELDYDLVPDDLSQRIAFYLMRNMDQSIHPDGNNGLKASGIVIDRDSVGGEDELMFDGSLLMQTAEKLLIENDEHNKKEELKIQKLITDALVERTRAVRKDIHGTIDDLFEQKNQQTLTLEGKERLLRFCLLDNSLEKLVHMFEEQAKNESDATSTAPSTPKVSEVGQVKDKAGAPLLQLPGLDQGVHESSNEMITSGPILSPHNTENFTHGYFAGVDQTFQPHQVVIESADGKNVPIDNSTGRPVLMRSISHTSIHAKEQEQEEGEFHRLGFFIQQRNNSQNSLVPYETTTTKPLKDTPMLNSLPSGSELRDAIIKAKGIESVTDLIDKISTSRVNLEKIYDLQTPLQEPDSRRDRRQSSGAEESELDTKSIDSFEDAETDLKKGDEVTAVVDEVYDKLLNDAQRVRSKDHGKLI